MVAQTDEPYVFTNNDPLNATDPLGLFCMFGHVSQRRNSSCRGASFAKKIVHFGERAAARETGHRAVGLSLTAIAGFGVGGMGSISAGVAGDGVPFVSATIGGGGGSPVASVGVGVFISNAQRPEDLRGAFAYEGGSVDLGPGVGAGSEQGTGSSNQSIVTGSGSVNIGAADLFPFPVPFEFHGGISNTWTTP
jgi:hypothetical protein